MRVESDDRLTEHLLPYLREPQLHEIARGGQGNPPRRKGAAASPSCGGS